MISESPGKIQKKLTLSVEITGYVSEYQSKGQFYIPGSIILRQHTLKYLPQAVPKSTLSDTVLNSHDEEKDPQSKRRILMKITKLDSTNCFEFKKYHLQVLKK
jgi:hypothetical protein